MFPLKVITSIVLIYLLVVGEYIYNCVLCNRRREESGLRSCLWKTLTNLHSKSQGLSYLFGRLYNVFIVCVVESCRWAQGHYWEGRGRRMAQWLVREKQSRGKKIQEPSESWSKSMCLLLPRILLHSIFFFSSEHALLRTRYKLKMISKKCLLFFQSSQWEDKFLFSKCIRSNWYLVTLRTKPSWLFS